MSALTYQPLTSPLDHPQFYTPVQPKIIPKRPCSRCGREFSALGKHFKVCKGPAPKHIPSYLPKGHSQCECGRYMAPGGRCCYRCSDKDRRFAVLEYLIERGYGDAVPWKIPAEEWERAQEVAGGE